jgi:hypothetical protein
LPIKQKQKYRDNGSITPSKQQHSSQKSRGDANKASTTKHAKVSKRVVDEGSRSASSSSKVARSNKWVRSDNEEQPKISTKNRFRIHIIKFYSRGNLPLPLSHLTRSFMKNREKFLQETLGIRDNEYHGSYNHRDSAGENFINITIMTYTFTNKADLNMTKDLTRILCPYTQLTDMCPASGDEWKTDYWIEE